MFLHDKNWKCPSLSHAVISRSALHLIGSQTLKMKNAEAAKTINPTTYQSTLTKLKVWNFLGFHKTLMVRTSSWDLSLAVDYFHQHDSALSEFSRHLMPWL